MTARQGDGMPAIDADAIRRAVSGERRLPKRFYQAVTVAAGEGGFQVKLDGRALRTPLKAALVVPTRALADAVAGEWVAQEEHVDPASMPLTRLANTAIDRVGTRRSEIVGEIASYAQSDLLCYRADGPDRLVLRQAQHWDPLLQGIEQAIGGRFILIQGVVHHAQPAETIARFRARIDAYDRFVLTALHNMVTLTGSAILADAVVSSRIAVEAAWAAAHVDEDWQIEQWGVDEEAAARRAARKDEFATSARFSALVAT